MQQSGAGRSPWPCGSGPRLSLWGEGMGHFRTGVACSACLLWWPSGSGDPFQWKCPHSVEQGGQTLSSILVMSLSSLGQIPVSTTWPFAHCSHLWGRRGPGRCPENLDAMMLQEVEEDEQHLPQVFFFSRYRFLFLHRVGKVLRNVTRLVDETKASRWVGWLCSG